ncbi:MAG: DUF1254 domain-containing protein [Kofleriaceae bacterium]|nr:DUF1254 domain-containing protein [Kofleriaceae bacterium]
MIPVTPDNFNRAESDMYFEKLADEGGLGVFAHHRQLVEIDRQTVIRSNRDTLYSTAVFDLDAASVTVTLPDPGARFMSMQVIDEDQYTHEVVYASGPYVLNRADIGTRYVLCIVRILVDPNDPADLEKVHQLQDTIDVHQEHKGSLELPDWDPLSRKKVHDALMQLGATVRGTAKAFGTRAEVDPIRHLIGTATGWGGNPRQDAMYIGITPEKNDGKHVYRLTVRDVPVDGFWSISVYNAQGYFESNSFNKYTVNNITAQRAADGTIVVQFGGTSEDPTVNWLPVPPGWNYVVRLYRPRHELLDGHWTFPEAQLVT